MWSLLCGTSQKIQPAHESRKPTEEHYNLCSSLKQKRGLLGRFHMPVTVPYSVYSKRKSGEILDTLMLGFTIRAGADQSLARPGRDQAPATKLGIYSTYSPRSSIRFLARYI
jgi:hypothetical protein